MSIDVKDHRRYAEGKLAESIKRAEAKIEAEKELLPQAASEFANTGDANLDKLIRAVQEELNKCQSHAVQVAQLGVACINDEQIRKHQAEFFFTQGKMRCCTEVIEMVGRIVTEAKQSSALALVP